MSDLGGLVRPQVTVDDAIALARDLWRIKASPDQVTELGSFQDRNFRIRGLEPAVVLKIANSAYDVSELHAQHAALHHVRRHQVTAPEPVGEISPIETSNGPATAHMLTYVEGTPLLELSDVTLDHCRLLGRTAGQVCAALADFNHPGALNPSAWDLRLGTEVLKGLDGSLLDSIEPVMAALSQIADQLPTQVIHGDLTDDNVVLTPHGTPGVIDFGDIGESWRCAELAVTLTCLLGKTSDDVRAVLAAVEGFRESVQLSDTELAALWPLVVLRAGVLVAFGTEQTILEADNHYAMERTAAERAMLDAALSLDAEEMTWLIRGVGQPLGAPRLISPVPAHRFRTIDLSVTSSAWDDGRWLAQRAPSTPAASRYGEYRLDRAQPLTKPGSQPTFSLAGELAGQVIQACTLPGTPPRYVRPHAEEVWRQICPDPSEFISTDIAAPTPDPSVLLERRGAAMARVQEHYYDQPPQIERGWAEFLIDTRANVYVDVVNNVATTGHAHPALAAIAARQWSLLNTNSRFHYAAAVELAERLAALAPEGLDQVFFVNSGSEAVDLAIQLAQVATGRTRMIAAREAYHGWTQASDAVTSSVGDNPNALGTRPDWVELIDAPNQVRGTHRGPDSGSAYLADLDAQLSALETSQIAGVILEPIFGNGGGVLLPQGYLAGVFERIRALGGLCISDEVQVGYGRLGHHFWGFEQQQATPDIITIAKAMGNGQPLGAVITTKAIASAFGTHGSFFSSAGGSPVSASIGLGVLDILEGESLQANARVVGDHFHAGLVELATRHTSIGAVHGMGLYLSLELVTDHKAFTPAPGLAHAVCEEMLTEGVIVQPTGDHKNVLKLKPPMVISSDSVDFVLAALDRVLSRVTRR